MITKRKREHPAWTERQRMPEAMKARTHNTTGQWQYLYDKDKVQISCVQLYGYPIGASTDPDAMWKSFQWEIYCLKGDVLEDTERYPSLEAAEKRIKELLGDEEISEPNQTTF